MDRIGKGGEGTLYLVRDLELGVYRAAKQLPLSRKREAKLLRLLEHPAMPGMIDYVEQGEFCYLIMEYIRGKSLRMWLEEGRRFSAEEVVGMGRTVLRVLGYLHAQKPAVYYGDLKPENLMLTEDGNLYLVDFGSAVTGYERHQYVCMGTRGYAAPEQYEGQIGPASDIYALGKTLEELCVFGRFGRFGKSGRVALGFFHPELWRFIRKCCQRQPEKRWQGAAEAEAALARCVPLTKKMWGRMVTAAGIALAVLVFLGMWNGRMAERWTKEPEFPLTTALSPITAWYYSMSYRTAGGEVRAVLDQNMELAIRRLSRRYTSAEDQNRLTFLLALHRAASQENVNGKKGQSVWGAAEEYETSYLLSEKSFFGKTFLSWTGKKVQAAQFGGFDVEVGTGEAPDDWDSGGSDWGMGGNDWGGGSETEGGDWSGDDGDDNSGGWGGGSGITNGGSWSGGSGSANGGGWNGNGGTVNGGNWDGSSGMTNGDSWSGGSGAANGSGWNGNGGNWNGGSGSVNGENWNGNSGTTNGSSWNSGSGASGGGGWVGNSEAVSGENASGSSGTTGGGSWSEDGGNSGSLGGTNGTASDGSSQGSSVEDSQSALSLPVSPPMLSSSVVPSIQPSILPSTSPSISSSISPSISPSTPSLPAASPSISPSTTQQSSSSAGTLGLDELSKWYLPRLTEIVYWSGEVKGNSNTRLYVKIPPYAQILSLRVNHREADWRRQGRYLYIEDTRQVPAGQKHTKREYTKRERTNQEHTKREHTERESSEQQIFIEQKGTEDTEHTDTSASIHIDLAVLAPRGAAHRIFIDCS